jgi:putative ABC transport system permease protein
MLRLKLLPWEYGVRNLFRRPWRSALTLAALSTVILLVLAVVGFVRGLEQSFVRSGDERVVLVYSLGMAESLEYSVVEAGTADLLAASLPGIKRRFGQPYLSPEVYLATRAAAGREGQSTTALVRGVTPAALRVRRLVQIVDGHWPGPGEVLVGRLAAAKLGRSAEELAAGQTVEFEGRKWRISGRFAAAGSVFESEMWCRLEDLQQAQKRQDLSLVAMTLAPGAGFGEVDLFCKSRLDLELQATRETDYYATLNAHYRPVRLLAWAVVGLVAGAGVFAGLNTMFAAVVGRARELAALQAIGFLRRAITLSLVQESTLLATAAALVAAVTAIVLLNGAAVRLTMGAFLLRIDGTTVLWGCCAALLLGVFGAIPPAVRAMWHPVAEGLKAA